MDQFAYAQAAQQMLPSPGMPGGGQMPFQKPSTELCKQAADVLQSLANQYKAEGQMTEYGQITGMVARLVKLLGRKIEKDNQVTEAILGSAGAQSMGQY